LNNDKRNELTKDFIDNVLSISDEIDPSEQYHWDSLILGWALAKGLSTDDAIDFEIHFEYPY
jgi:hypothetical protein